MNRRQVLQHLMFFLFLVGIWITAGKSDSMAAGAVEEVTQPASHVESGIMELPREDGGSFKEKVQSGEKTFEISGGCLLRYGGAEAVVTIPDSVTSIAQGAFYKNQNIEKIIVPASVKKIDQFAFYHCDYLKYIVFKGNCPSVGANMIYSCRRLTNIVAPNNSRQYQYAYQNHIRVFTREKTCLVRKEIRLLKGDKESLVLYNNIDYIQWKTSAPSVVTVSSGGKIRCRKKGKAKITAVVGKQKYSLTVYVLGKSEKQRISQVVRIASRKGAGTRKKIRAVHDWLIQHVKYDYENYLQGAVPKRSHTSKGALLCGVAVCDGYAKAFQKIMKAMDIPCQIVLGYVQGSGHAWNRVKIGRKWYYVDVTFDDPIINGKNTNQEPRYEYFLKTEKQMRKSHLWE